MAYISCRDQPSNHFSSAVAQEREVEGDLFLQDMGDGLAFRPGTFDGVISISALQWLCNADRKTHHPPKRLYRFFSSLFACMVSAQDNNIPVCLMIVHVTVLTPYTVCWFHSWHIHTWREIVRAGCRPVAIAQVVEH